MAGGVLGQTGLVNRLVAQPRRAAQADALRSSSSAVSFVNVYESI